MSLLFKHLRVHQVFGANTDVGKTVITSALARASAARNHRVFYLKPVSTGPLEDADDHHVARYGGPGKQLIQPHCIFRYAEPVSPHLAAALAQDANPDEMPPPSDETFINAVAGYIRRCASKSTARSHMYVETAGGVHSPTLSGTTQLDSYRPLFLPTVLVGDARLGGISATIAAYESLLLRGYILDAVLLFDDTYYRNAEYLTPYFAERGVHVAALPAPPSRVKNDAGADQAATEAYYSTIVPADGTGPVFGAVEHLDTRHAQRIARLQSMPRQALDDVWWPFVQHGIVRGEQDVAVIDSAYSDYFSIFRDSSATPASTKSPLLDTPATPSTRSLLQPQLDGSASWWTQTFGHAHPRLTLAAARASGRYGHVMFPQAAHAPALTLSTRLVHGPPGAGWASRAFISDNGSTGMEIALKMALRAYTVRCAEAGAAAETTSPALQDGKKLGVLGLKGSYHGDTIGAMDACTAGDSVYTCEWHDAKGHWLDAPQLAIKEGRVVITLPASIGAHAVNATCTFEAESWAWAYDIEPRLDTPLAHAYRAYVKAALESAKTSGGPALAALVLEPLVMGAGGMVFVDPLFQRVLVDVVRASSILAPAPAPARPRAPSSGAWTGLPVIYDEVFAGLYRLGVASSGPLLGAHPDISVHAKMLTGGLLPLAVTLASDAIFQAFLSGDKADALLHGHSYSAHAVGCSVANEALDMIYAAAKGGEWEEAKQRWAASGDAHDVKAWSFWDPNFVRTLSQVHNVAEIATLGTVLAIKTVDSGGYLSSSAQTLLEPLKAVVENDSTFSSAPGGAPYGVHFRTLGNVAYFMLSLNSSPATIRSLEDKIWHALAEQRSI